MSIAEPTTKAFEPGSSGWTAADLEDRKFRRFWDQGQYEIVEGVLAIMPPAVFAGGEALGNIEFILRSYLKAQGLNARFATESDIVLAEMRVYRADLAVIMEADERRLMSASSDRTGDWRYRPLTLPPSLIIESVSRGHEAHDRVNKRRAYAEFGVANYWLLDAFAKSLECLVLEGIEYKTELSGTNSDKLESPRLFPGLAIDLAEVWGR